MKKVLGSLVLFGVLATGGISHAEDLNLAPEDISEECFDASRAGDNEILIECYKDAIKIYQQHGDYDGVYWAKEMIGNFYSNLKDYKNAEKYYIEALEGAKKIGNKRVEAGAYSGLGYIYKKKGDKKKAKEYYTNAYNNYKAAGDKVNAEYTLKLIKKLNKSK